MVLVGTSLNVLDNSGAIEAKCIKILGSSKCNHSHLGDKLMVSIRRVRAESKVKKRSVHCAVLVHQKSKTRRKNGSYIYFDKNSIVLIKKNKWNDPIGNRMMGMVPKELRYKKCLKVVLMAWTIF